MIPTYVVHIEPEGHNNTVVLAAIGDVSQHHLGNHTYFQILPWIDIPVGSPTTNLLCAKHPWFETSGKYFLPRYDEWPWFYGERVPTRLITTPYLSHKFTREHSFNCFLKRGFIIDSPHKYSRFLETATFQGLGVDGGDGANTVTVIAQIICRRQHTTDRSAGTTPTLRESFRIPDTPPRPSFWLCPLSSTESGCVSWSFPKFKTLHLRDCERRATLEGAPSPTVRGFRSHCRRRSPLSFLLAPHLDSHH